jgi:hypothetical protein
MKLAMNHLESEKIPSGYLLHSHGIDGPFIDGLPNLKLVILTMANC